MSWTIHREAVKPDGRRLDCVEYTVTPNEEKGSAFSMILSASVPFKRIETPLGRFFELAFGEDVAVFKVFGSIKYTGTWPKR